LFTTKSIQYFKLFKNSSNKYTFEMEMFITDQDNKIGETKSKTKRLRVCTRIK